MGAIRKFKDGIFMDPDVWGDKVYYTDDQGCGTIWFSSVVEARKFIKKKGRITGRDSGLCEVCGCHYSYGTDEWKKYHKFACNEWKEKMKKEVK